MKRKILKIIKFINKTLKPSDINWCLIGSVSLFLQGVKIQPHDIDILTDKEGAYKINKLFKKYEIQGVKPSKTELFYSFFGRFVIKGILVEIAGDMSIFLNGKWSKEIMKRLTLKKYVNYKGIIIPVSPLKEQLESYKLLNREKDSEKIRILQEYLGFDKK